MKIKTILRILVILVILLLIPFLVFQFMPQASMKGKEASFTVDTHILYEAFSTDESKANETYLGKVVETSGFIVEQLLDESGRSVLILSNESNGVGQVYATLEEGKKKPGHDYSPGKKISVKGLCTGYLMEVVLNKASVISSD